MARTLRPFKSAQLGALSEAKYDWAHDPAVALEVAGHLYALIDRHYPYLWPAGKRPAFSKPGLSAQDVLHQVFNVFRKVYPKQDIKIAKVVREQSINHKRANAPLVGYTVIAERIFEQTQASENALVSCDYWVHWRLHNRKVSNRYGTQVNAGRTHDRSRQRLHLLAMLVLSSAGSGFLQEENSFTVDYQAEVASEYLTDYAHKIGLDHIMGADRCKGEGFFKRLCYSIALRGPDGPLEWLRTLARRYRRLILRHRTGELLSYENSPALREFSVPLRRDRAELRVLHDELRRQTKLAESHQLLTGMPEHREGLTTNTWNGAHYHETVADVNTAAFLSAVNKLHPCYQGGKDYRITDFEGNGLSTEQAIYGDHDDDNSDVEYEEDRDGVHAHAAMELWFSYYDWTGAGQQDEVVDRFNNMGVCPLQWMAPLEHGATLAELRRNTANSLPEFPNHFNAALKHLQHLSTEYHDQHGIRTRASSNDEFSGWYNDRELSLDKYWKKYQMRAFVAWVEAQLKEAKDCGDGPDPGNWLADGIYRALTQADPNAKPYKPRKTKKSNRGPQPAASRTASLAAPGAAAADARIVFL